MLPKRVKRLLRNYEVVLFFHKVFNKKISRKTIDLYIKFLTTIRIDNIVFPYNYGSAKEYNDALDYYICQLKYTNESCSISMKEYFKIMEEVLEWSYMQIFFFYE